MRQVRTWTIFLCSPVACAEAAYLCLSRDEVVINNVLHQCHTDYYVQLSSKPWYVGSESWLHSWPIGTVSVLIWTWRGTAVVDQPSSQRSRVVHAPNVHYA